MVPVVSPLLKALQWLPGGCRIKSKLTSVTDKAFCAPAPAHLCSVSLVSPMYPHPSCTYLPAHTELLPVPQSRSSNTQTEEWQPNRTFSQNSGSTLRSLTAQALPLNLDAPYLSFLAQTSLPFQKAFLDLSSLDMCPVIMYHGTLHLPVS